ncbi:hypothetical protein [Muricoccus vinaceus]|uniref:Uncharacterized protein n=1 Tax=Muricoccus vinaceus TaxID=424704 RepID=A0ABV6IL29_9PROT
MATFAFVRDGVVAEVIPPREDKVPLDQCYPPAIFANFVQLTTAQAKKVEPGWLYDGTTFAAPGDPEPQVVRARIIRSLAFRDRLSQERQQEISVAAMQMAAGGDGSLLTYLLNQAAGSVTDLDDPRVQEGVAKLAAAGLVSAAEAEAILADGSAGEAA